MKRHGVQRLLKKVAVIGVYTNLSWCSGLARTRSLPSARYSCTHNFILRLLCVCRCAPPLGSALDQSSCIRIGIGSGLVGSYFIYCVTHHHTSVCLCLCVFVFIPCRQRFARQLENVICYNCALLYRHTSIHIY